MVDVFYVRDVFGLKVEQEEKLDVLRDGLLDIVSEDWESGKPEEKAKSTGEALSKWPKGRAKQAKGEASPV